MLYFSLHSGKREKVLLEIITIACFLKNVHVMGIDLHGLHRHIAVDIVINAFYVPSFTKN